MNDYGSLFSAQFFESVWKKAERSLRQECDCTVLYYPLVDGRAITYWSVRLLPLRRNAFAKSKMEIGMATTERHEILCLVAHHDDPGLVALIGECDARWLVAMVFMLDGKIVYCRSVFAGDYLSKGKTMSRIYLLSDALPNPIAADLYDNFKRKTTSYTTVRVPGDVTVVAERVQAGWRTLGAAGGKTTFSVLVHRDAEYVYWIGPTTTLKEQLLAYDTDAKLACSSPDGVLGNTLLPMYDTSFVYRFRWPFLFERLLALCLVGLHVLPFSLLRKILDYLPPTLFDERFEPRWVSFQQSIARLPRETPRKKANKTQADVVS